MSLTVLIIGGYGTFGGRIVELLEHEPHLTLLVAGRSLERARAFVSNRRNLVPVVFDRDGDIDRQLESLRPNILVDASGPFQTYGTRVIEACVAHGVNYLDLADGSDFVAGVGKFDEAARAAGLFVLSGASSFPALSSAAVRHLATGMVRIDTIRGGVAPSPFVNVGMSVIRAIASYAGRGYPFTDHMRFTIAPPGYLPLRNRIFSLVDVPGRDLPL